MNGRVDGWTDRWINTWVGKQMNKASLYPFCSLKNMSCVAEFQKKYTALITSLLQVVFHYTRNNHGSFFLNIYYIPSTVLSILQVISLILKTSREAGIMALVHR